MEINQFVAVTDDPEFCLGTTLLYIDTRNTDLVRLFFLCRPFIHSLTLFNSNPLRTSFCEHVNVY